MVKYFCYKEGSDLEKMINNWLETNELIQINCIQYQVIVADDEVWHHALLTYSLST